MSEPYVGEIFIFPWEFSVRGTASCSGQLLAIQQNMALFSLLGTTYGGDGVTWFALPNLQGRSPRNIGMGHVWGEPGGATSVTLLSTQVPGHTHTLVTSEAATGTGSTVSNDPTNRFIARATTPLYSDPVVNTSLHPASLQSSGGSTPHTNMQPYLVLNFAIALQGLFPSRN